MIKHFCDMCGVPVNGIDGYIDFEYFIFQKKCTNDFCENCCKDLKKRLEDTYSEFIKEKQNKYAD